MKNESTTTTTAPAIPAALVKLAEVMDSAILVDRHGDICLLQRIRDEGGVAIVRHRPDPGNFHPVSDWMLALSGGYAEKLVV